MRRLFLAVTLLLTGCAGFNPFGPGPVDPEDATATPDLVLTGAGVLKFQCSADKDGYWWRFIAPEVVLMNPAGRKIATQGADFNFTAPDKSKLSSKIVSSAPGKTDADLKDVLFRVTPAGKIKTGTLTPYRWVKRDEAKGGIPSATASPSATCSSFTSRRAIPSTRATCRNNHFSPSERPKFSRRISLWQGFRSYIPKKFQVK